MKNVVEVGDPTMTLTAREIQAMEDKNQARRNKRFPEEQVRQRKSYKWMMDMLRRITSNTPEDNLKLLCFELRANGGYFTHRGALIQYKNESMELAIKDYQENKMGESKINEIMVVDDKSIKGFFRDYRWLSNYHPCHIEYEGQVYQSSEAAYQAAKTLDHSARATFAAVDAHESKKMGRKVVLRTDWEEVKDQVMLDILRLKFQQEGLKQMLKDTGDKYLEETNWWNDTYWGVCEGKGTNKLGQLLMQIRDGK